MRPVCVIGLGLIGGSVLRAARAAGRSVWGATASEQDAEAAVADGFAVADTVDDALVRAAGEDAIVVLAVPLPATETVLYKIAERAPHCLLTDVVSVKAPVLALVRRILPHVHYAGGHPMAGVAASGWIAGSATLFERAAWVVTAEPDTELGTWREVARLALDCGAQVVPTTAAEHDAAVAVVSHLPHVLAAVLAATGAEAGPLALSLAAGSFGDGTRVAGTRAELVLAMCEGNREQLLGALDDALGKLGVARGALASTGSLRATVRGGNLGRAELVRHKRGQRVRTKVDLAGPRALEELCLLGRRGGRIIGLDGDLALAELPEDDAR
ncbi:MAG TPA: prephenate dehydrogenase [Actinophytocola sp.]|uniref:prephenate dehydrogenase n=1 Tax=Actinophytocola sp. TaxID=1872138 RepID=UPI002DDD8DCB|nr:prephenate dehydrogenase [Actinophytocola sp.]HEV2780018.1 prephenate dehydrogenase [Actinophytocola sp.]